MAAFMDQFFFYWPFKMYLHYLSMTSAQNWTFLAQISVLDASEIPKYWLVVVSLHLAVSLKAHCCGTPVLCLFSF